MTHKETLQMVVDFHEHGISYVDPLGRKVTRMLMLEQAIKSVTGGEDPPEVAIAVEGEDQEWLTPYDPGKLRRITARGC